MRAAFHPMNCGRSADLPRGGLVPDLTLILDLPVEQAIVRRGRSADRMESRGLEYLERVRARLLGRSGTRGERDSECSTHRRTLTCSKRKLAEVVHEYLAARSSTKA